MLNQVINTSLLSQDACGASVEDTKSLLWHNCKALHLYSTRPQRGQNQKELKTFKCIFVVQRADTQKTLEYNSLEHVTDVQEGNRMKMVAYDSEACKKSLLKFRTFSE